MSRESAVLLFLIAGLGGPAAAQSDRRPIPYRILEPPEFARAVAAGTRTRTGRPGERYWQQGASYRLEATLDTASNLLTGRGWVRYVNHGPDTLRNLFFHLYQNIFASTAMRNDVVPLTGGMRLTGVAVRGRALGRTTDADQEGFEVDGTILRVHPAEPLVPGDSIEAEFAWNYRINLDGGPRGGTDGGVWFVAYWYPQLAVYDDVGRRWQTDPYLGNAEFYMGYADYEVALTLPAGFLVGATGQLVNAGEVLSARSLARLEQARGGSVVQVVGAGEGEGGAGRATAAGTNGALTWRFRASNVRDFAFGTSHRYVWDATIALPGDANGDGRPDTTLINTFYRPERVTWSWDRGAAFARNSIEWLSRYLWPYPYPHATAVEGVASCQGMEYPMITCIGGRRDSLSLYSVVVHELGHMWFPMQVGSDEKRYAWQDEGLTRFNQWEAMRAYFGSDDSIAAQVRRSYFGRSRTGLEVELMRHGDLYPPGTTAGASAYGVASYSKMALNLRSLRAILGDSVFLAAYREYGRRWVGKHPTPFDFWNSFEEASGRDLDWFWRTWWYETWPLDQAIGAVVPRGRDLEVTIEDRGLAPMPVRLAITRRDGTVERREVPVEVWLRGERRTRVRLARGNDVIRVEIDPENVFPDVDRANQAWRR